MIVLMLSMLIFLLVGVPLGIAIGIAIFIALMVDPVVNIEYISLFLYTGFESFPLMSLPFFMLAGTIMDEGGLSKRLVGVANAMVGGVKGGLGYTTILACMFFGGMSGSAPATVAAIGTIMIPMMVRYGYDKYYATALVTVSGGLGVIVPPSYPMVMYGVTNSVSIPDLFIAGIGPAIVVTMLLCIVNCIICTKRNYKGDGERFSFKRLGSSIGDAKFSILMPFIILVGIYGGYFSPTEASVVAVVYALFIGKFVYKEVTFRGIWEMYFNNMAFLGGLLFTFAPAMALATMFSLYGVVDSVNSFFSTVSGGFVGTMFIIFGILLFSGMFVETTPICVILSPILLPVVKQYGMDPVQFGLVIVLALCIAFVTPPVASNLYIASSLTGISVDKITRHMVPFIIAIFIALILITFIPQLSIGIL